jgi:hypothetical protein
MAKILYNFRLITRRHILEDSNLHSYCRENPSSQIKISGSIHVHNQLREILNGMHAVL